MLRKLLLGLLAVLMVLAGVVLYRAATFLPPEQTAIETVAHAIDAQTVAARLSQAVQFATVSQQPPAPIDRAPFAGFIAWLEKTYPAVHEKLSREIVGGHTLLYKWNGKEPAGKPILLTAHYDVVPVIPGTEKDWKHPPFAGVIADGYVWGRGALDDKSAVISILEAVTYLLAQGYQPRQTIYLSFGHDEELGGDHGAAAATAHLKARNVRLAWSLDEGSFVLDGIVPGVPRPVASINIAEKGYLTLVLTARGQGGHSSMPPRETAVGILAGAIVKLQQAPMPGGLDGITGETFGALARYMSFDKRVLFANQWLFGPLIEATLAKSPASNAMLRTTTAPTMLSGSIKENVLPIEATATVNFRLHPRDTPDAVVAHVKRTIADERVSVAVRRADPASPLASVDSAGYRAIANTVRRVYGDISVAPGLTIAGTDSKHYQKVSDNAYRFNPMMITPQDLAGFHGTNERISLENLVRATRFYIELIKSGAG
ncbi:MAG: M20 family peptidase [Betaproteobacteria bacterium]|nr:M20 family peptidase [Betaproteobacteria bacterium]